MKNVIIADDSTTARMFVRRCFEVAGLADSSIQEAADGAQVLTFVQQGKFDLIITDLNMPVLDGRALLSKLRQSGNGVPVIVVSSAANAALTEELLALGAAAVVKKPPSPALALAALNRCRGLT
jgi:two-component system, chemotaxis family, chemotaxis protein CheY